MTSPISPGGSSSGNYNRDFKRITDAEITYPPMTLSRGARGRRQSSSTYEPTTSLPKSSATIPFKRDGDFIERAEIFDKATKKCRLPSSRTALVGLGGVGKSQLAIELAYQTRDRSPEIWVFWIHASNAARFEQSFRNIANCINVGQQNSDVSIYQLVHDWLSHEKNGKWVIIMDNVDEIDFLLEVTDKSSAPLISYLPSCNHGSVLFTTRSKDVALKLVEENNMIMVGPMDSAEAISLFKKKLGNQEESGDEQVANLVAGLEFMPLAIVQAASYISQRKPRYTVQKYLKDFQKSDQRRTGLLNHEGGQLRRDWEAKSSILITWEISFNHICRRTPSATDLLALMSFYDRQGIPEILLRNYTDRESPQKDWSKLDSLYLADSDSDDGLFEAQPGGTRFEDDLHTLRNYSFISIAPDGKTFEMHRLVQLATRRWLDSQGQLEKWKRTAIRNTLTELPIGEYENWPRCQMLFPHAKMLATQPPKGEESLKDWSSLLYHAAWYAWRAGNGIDAERMATQALNANKLLLPYDHEDVVDCMAMLGLAQNIQGRWTEAESIQTEVMEICKRKFGNSHNDTLTSMANLAATYFNLGRLDAAEELEAQVMEIRRKLLGESDSDTLVAMTNLALTLREQGRLGDAQNLGEQVMRMSTEKLGVSHPDTLDSMNSLAGTYLSEGKWSAAEKLSTQVMKMRAQTLGQHHPDTLSSMSDVASTYWNQGRLDLAEEMELQVISIRKELLGDNHPETLTGRANLALTYLAQGKWIAAEKICLDALERRKLTLGEGHPDTLDSMANLASVFRKQRRLTTAESLCKTVLEKRKRKFGPQYPGVINAMSMLVHIYNDSGMLRKDQHKLCEAEQLGLQVLEARKQKLGDQHPDTLISKAALASTYRRQGRTDDAFKMCSEVIQTSKQLLGENHSDTLNVWNELMLLYTDQQLLDDAWSHGRSVLKRRETALGITHPDTLESMHNLSFVYCLQRKWDVAEELEAKVFAARKAALGEEHELTMESLRDLSCVWKMRGRDSQAFEGMRAFLRWRNREGGGEVMETKDIEGRLRRWVGEDEGIINSKDGGVGDSKIISEETEGE